MRLHTSYHCSHRSSQLLKQQDAASVLSAENGNSILLRIALTIAAHRQHSTMLKLLATCDAASARTCHVSDEKMHDHDMRTLALVLADCPAGTYGAACDPCPAGSYCPANGSISRCPTNMNSPARAKTMDDCVCNPGAQALW
jgi:hypothetical protein